MYKKEDYVSLEVANLLKELRIHIDSNAYYSNVSYSPLLSICYEKVTSLWSDDQLYAPHLYEVQKWLREKKNVIIDIITYRSEEWEFTYHIAGDRMEMVGGYYGTYQKALENGIKNALKHIKKEEK